MIKKFWLLVVFLVCSCNTVQVPQSFVYKEIKTEKFTLASWQKITDPKALVKIYIEGDGASFDAYGKPTSNPTPKGAVLREIAFGDNSPNVVYLARPCQFVQDSQCAQKYWTTARFSEEVIASEREAVLNVAQKNEVILIGFSGGAQVAGLIAVTTPELHIKKMITIAGNLDHVAWTSYHQVPPLEDSLNLADYKDEYLALPQEHFVSTEDTVMPPKLVYDFVGEDNIREISSATHDKGWERVYPLIQLER